VDQGIYAFSRCPSNWGKVTLWCTRLNVPDWILWIGATASSAFISIWTVLLGLKGIYWTCVEALIVVSNACAVPYYDLNGALFVLFPLAVVVVATGHAILVAARQIVQYRRFGK